jgi:hypothetical protein
VSRITHKNSRQFEDSSLEITLKQKEGKKSFLKKQHNQEL